MKRLQLGPRLNTEVVLEYGLDPADRRQGTGGITIRVKRPNKQGMSLFTVGMRHDVVGEGGDHGPGTTGAEIQPHA